MQQTVLALPVAVQRPRRVVHRGAVELDAQSALWIGRIESSHEVAAIEDLMLSDRQHDTGIFQRESAGSLQNGLGSSVRLRRTQLDHAVASSARASDQRRRDLSFRNDLTTYSVVDRPHAVQSRNLGNHVQQRTHCRGDGHSVTNLDVTAREGTSVADQLTSPDTPHVAGDRYVLRLQPTRYDHAVHTCSGLMTGNGIRHS